LAIEFHVKATKRSEAPWVVTGDGRRIYYEYVQDAWGYAVSQARKVGGVAVRFAMGHGREIDRVSFEEEPTPDDQEPNLRAE